MVGEDVAMVAASAVRTTDPWHESVTAVEKPYISDHPSQSCNKRKQGKADGLKFLALSLRTYSKMPAKIEENR